MMPTDCARAAGAGVKEEVNGAWGRGPKLVPLRSAVLDRVGPKVLPKPEAGTGPDITPLTPLTVVVVVAVAVVGVVVSRGGRGGSIRRCSD